MANPYDIDCQRPFSDPTFLTQAEQEQLSVFQGDRYEFGVERTLVGKRVETRSFADSSALRPFIGENYDFSQFAAVTAPPLTPLRPMDHKENQPNRNNNQTNSNPNRPYKRK